MNGLNQTASISLISRLRLAPTVVMRFVKKIVRKRYFGKAVYEHIQVLLPIPAKYRKLVEPILDVDLDVTVEVEDGVWIITVKPVDRKM